MSIASKPRFAILALLLATVSVALSACGSSGGGAAPPASDGASEGTQSKSVDAASLGLQQGDLPPGWVSVAQASVSASPTATAKAPDVLAQCEGVTGTVPADARTEQDAAFVSGSSQAVSTIVPYTQQSDINADKAELTNPKAQDCINQTLLPTIEKNFPAGVTATGGSLTLNPGSSGGPDDIIATATGQVDVTGPKGSAQVYIDVWFIAANNIEGEVVFLGDGAQVPTDVQHTAATAVAQRIANEK